jgi:hypothetical protein
MVGYTFDLLDYTVPSQSLEGIDNAGMQQPSSLLEQTAIDNLVCEGVLERVLVFREEPGFIEELSRL